ncbi:Amidophosphoribosyltransferase, variant 2 [Balamuthia mandrillaris]
MVQLKGHLALGHTRYSTIGASNLSNAQPFVIETMHGPLAVAHNGELTKQRQLRRSLMESGIGMFTTTDSEVITQMLSARAGQVLEETDEPDWEARIRYFMSHSEGAYSLAIMTKDAIFAVRDPHGLRPLCIGRLPCNGANSHADKSKGEEEEHGIYGSHTGLAGYVIASESCALTTIGAEFMRDIKPGEIVRIDKNGISSFMGVDLPPKSAFCVFEYVYFSRPDSLLDDVQLVHQVRQRLGRRLAIEQPCENADIVMGVPDSSTPAAIGYALQLGVPFSEGLTKNRYIGRTFIQPYQSLRTSTITLKFNALRQNLEGKNVVLVDDSIVRGSTLMHIVKLLRTTNPKSIHVRISCPPVRHPCFMGINMSTYEELIAHSKSVEEIRDHIGADTLGYLSLEGMMEVVEEGLTDAPAAEGDAKRGHCNACFSGNYPLDIEDLGRSVIVGEGGKTIDNKEKKCC